MILSNRGYCAAHSPEKRAWLKLAAGYLCSVYRRLVQLPRVSGEDANRPNGIVAVERRSRDLIGSGSRKAKKRELSTTE
jgi:hypothetical protein